MSHIINTHAKLNLALYVYPLMENGYHPIQSLFQTISLFDTLTIEKKQVKTLSISCSNSKVPLDENNILHKVYEYARPFINFGMHVHIDKHIPMGGGLGGGSSNAAGLLTAIFNDAPQLKDSLNNRDIAYSFGADIPFFLSGGTANVSGIGEHVHSTDRVVPHRYLILCPPFHVSTKVIYDAFDRSGLKRNAYINNYIVGENDLKKVVFTHYPILQNLERELERFGYPLYLSGSGGCTYIPLDKDDNISEIESIISNEFNDFSYIDVTSFPKAMDIQ